MINIAQFIRQLLPSTFHESNLIKSYLRVILSPIDFLSNVFLQFKDNVSYKLSKNSQICYLESVLNDAFDNSQRRIFITDAESVDMLIAYEYQDVRKIIVCEDISEFANYEVIAYQSQVIGNNLNKFIINLPNESQIITRETELRALTNRFRFAGKLFYIIYF